jgi:hypothetical protein
MVMSQFLKSRTADQCRIHHQKLLSKFKTFSEILNVLTIKFESNEKYDTHKIM